MENEYHCGCFKNQGMWNSPFLPLNGIAAKKIPVIFACIITDSKVAAMMTITMRSARGNLEKRTMAVEVIQCEFFACFEMFVVLRAVVSSA
jgi:hypothetical protein